MNSALEAIRSCKYLYLHSISEVEAEGLRLVLHEATLGESPTEDQIAQEKLPVLREMLKDSRAIAHLPGCRIFELHWPSYVGYAVENESYAAGEPSNSIGEGQRLVVYSKSVFLDYLTKATFAREDYPGPFQHWAICCLDHIVNVASTELPTIQVANDA